MPRFNIERWNAHIPLLDKFIKGWDYSTSGIKLTNHSLGTSPTFTPSDPLFSQQWHLGSGSNAINVQSVWDDYTGAGIKVGLLDDGVDYNHVDIDDTYNY